MLNSYKQMNIIEMFSEKNIKSRTVMVKIENKAMTNLSVYFPWVIVVKVGQKNISLMNLLNTSIAAKHLQKWPFYPSSSSNQILIQLQIKGKLTVTPQIFFPPRCRNNQTVHCFTFRKTISRKFNKSITSPTCLYCTRCNRTSLIELKNNVPISINETQFHKLCY